MSCFYTVIGKGTQAFLFFPSFPQGFLAEILVINEKKKKDKVTFCTVEFHPLSVTLFKISAFEGFKIGMLWLWSWIPGFLGSWLTCQEERRAVSNTVNS